MNRRVLVIEDDPHICEVVAYYLKKASVYDTSIVHSAEDALALIESGEEFDVILSDIMLPGIDGIEFCSRVRSRINCPIIFTSCLDDDDTIVKALTIGGDDYLVKPYHGPVLLAHIAATLRRCQNAPQSESVCFGELRIDGTTKRVYTADGEVSLSPTEYNILRYMAAHPHKFISYDELFENVWKKPSLGDYSSLFVHIRNLRKKIEADPSSPKLIRTHPSGGYIFAEDEVKA